MLWLNEKKGYFLTNYLKLLSLNNLRELWSIHFYDSILVAVFQENVSIFFTEKCLNYLLPSFLKYLKQ